MSYETSKLGHSAKYRMRQRERDEAQEGLGHFLRRADLMGINAFEPTWKPTAHQYVSIVDLFSSQNQLTEHVVETYTGPFYAKGGALIEHAGDMFRELTKGGGVWIPWGYILEKLERIQNNTTWDQQTVLDKGRTSSPERLAASAEWDRVGLHMFLKRVDELRTKTNKVEMPTELKESLLEILKLQDLLAYFIAGQRTIWQVQHQVEIVASKINTLELTPWPGLDTKFRLMEEAQKQGLY